ncbi:hypothetical protein PQR29_16445 [Paraburkholderia strydomiana]|uniref:hypothetical protein n=1 Tax=Paraburkholderia strydomiana TaxID=1245417 RepID=UPI00103B320D
MSAQLALRQVAKKQREAHDGLPDTWRAMEAIAGRHPRNNVKSHAGRMLQPRCNPYSRSHRDARVSLRHQATLCERAARFPRGVFGFHLVRKTADDPVFSTKLIRRDDERARTGW